MAKRIADETLFYRFTRVDKKDFTDDNSFQLAIASEYPVKRAVDEHFESLGIGKQGDTFLEVLSHKDGDYDLSRFNDDNRAAFLDEHHSSRHLGYVRMGAVSKDRVTRAVVTLDGASKLSKTRAKQIRSGSRPNTSLGYAHTAYLGAETLPDGQTVHRFAWVAREASSVADPADPTVGLGRAKRETRCIRCGGEFPAADMNRMEDGSYMCSDCQDAEEPADDTRANGERMFRVKKGEEKRISHGDLRDKVTQALDGDSRFKTERDNGNKYSDFNLHDIHQIINEDGEDDWEAIVSSPAWTGQYHSIGFDYDGDDVSLGESQKVDPKLTFEASERGLTPDGRLIRKSDEPYGNVTYADEGLQKDGKKRYPVNSKAHAKAAWSYINKEHNAAKYSPEDLAKVKAKIKAACKKFGVEISEERSIPVDSQNLTRSKTLNFMELTAEQKTEAEKLARAALEPQLRKTIEDENKTRVSEALKSRSKVNAEISKRCDEFVKDHGMKKRGAVAEELRKIANKHIVRTDEVPEAQIYSEFGQECLAEIAKVQPEPYMLRARGTDKEWKSYSMMRAIRSCVEKKSRMPDKSFELDIHQDMVRTAEGNGGILGSETDAGGFWVPQDAPTPAYHARLGRDGRVQRSRMVGERFTRDLYTGDFGSGGALVPTELMTPIIEPLRNWTALDKVNVRFLGGLSGNIVIPRQTGVVAPQAVSEIGALVASQPDFDQIAAKPRRMGNTTSYSKQLLFQSSPDAESIVRDDNFKQIALLVDEAGINGSGAANQPLGVMNQPGVFAVAFGGTATVALIESMATAIRKANIREPIAFLTTSNARGRLRSVAAVLVSSGGVTMVSLAGAPNALWTGTDEEGMLTGRPAHDSQQIPNDQLIAGAWDNLIWFQWAGIEVVVDPYTQAGTGEWKITMNTYNDFAVRHPQAFCITADSAAQ